MCARNLEPFEDGFSSLLDSSKQFVCGLPCVSTPLTVFSLSQVHDLGQHNLATWTGTPAHVLDVGDQNSA